MRETCFCGWCGELADREPVTAGATPVGLRCPRCGRVDALDWLVPAARRSLLDEAAARWVAADERARVAS